MSVIQYQESRLRRAAILNRLSSFGHVSYQRLSEEYYVSRSGIANDISYIKYVFAKEGLDLSFDHFGTYLEGNEVQIQKVLKCMILNHFDELEIIRRIADRKFLETVERSFRESTADKQIEIPESYFSSIIVSNLLMIQRSREGKKTSLKGKNQYGKYFLEFNKYPLVCELLHQLKEQHIYQFSQEEVQCLTYIIVGNGLRFSMKNETIPLVFREKIWQLIQKVSRGIQIGLIQDSHLEEDPLVHLYQLFLRIEAQTTIVDPLIDKIKQNYPSLYNVVWFTLNDSRWPYQVSLSEDEVGFVAIHFQVAIERVKRLNRFLSVCPSGMGISSFVSAKIRRILPDTDSIETAFVDKLNRLDLFDVDLIISTVDIPR